MTVVEPKISSSQPDNNNITLAVSVTISVIFLIIIVPACIAIIIMRKKKVKKAPLIQDNSELDLFPQDDGTNDKPYQDNINEEMDAIEENLKI